jgi:hypothetical protein
LRPVLGDVPFDAMIYARDEPSGKPRAEQQARIEPDRTAPK